MILTFCQPFRKAIHGEIDPDGVRLAAEERRRDENDTFKAKLFRVFCQHDAKVCERGSGRRANRLPPKLAVLRFQHGTFGLRQRAAGN